MEPPLPLAHPLLLPEKKQTMSREQITERCIRLLGTVLPLLSFLNDHKKDVATLFFSFGPSDCIIKRVSIIQSDCCCTAIVLASNTAF